MESRTKSCMKKLFTADAMAQSEAWQFARAADGGYWHIIMHSISAKRIPVASEHFLELPVL
jgi:hypothetical protein